MPVDVHEVFNQDNFIDAFLSDLKNARGLILVQSPFVSVRRIDRLRTAIKDCTQRGVRVCAFVQQPRVMPGDNQVAIERMESTQSASKMLSSLGVHVTWRQRIHEKLAVIDETTLWEGSLNILSHYDTFERMTRWLSRGKVEEVIESHRLDSCSTCRGRMGQGIPAFDSAWEAKQRQSIAAAIANRRKLLGFSQSELARKTNLKQSLISEVEAGIRDVRLSTLIRLSRQLRLGFRPLPWYMLPSVDDLFD